MTHRGHLRLGVGAAAAGLCVTGAAPFSPSAVVLVLMALLGALVPDLDHPDAALSRALGPLPWLVRRVCSNSLVWLLAGWRDVAPQHRVVRPPRPVAGVRLLTNRAAYAVLGEQRCLRTAYRVLAGRDRWRRCFRHRGLSHSLVALAVMTALVWLTGAAIALAAGATAAHGEAWTSGAAAIAAAAPAAVGFAAGYASHLVGDGMTESGVPLFAPWSWRRVHLLPHWLRIRMRTGVAS